ncbi:hypothetical protein Leryth_025945 [Lithospermum erythrorhizon]|nr:hypothetical protein Leryth_025945 [Lithospermum erythrorhizon]
MLLCVRERSTADSPKHHLQPQSQRSSRNQMDSALNTLLEIEKRWKISFDFEGTMEKIKIQSRS